VLDEEIDFLDQFLDAAKGSAPNRLLRDKGEPAFDLVQPMKSKWACSESDIGAAAPARCAPSDVCGSRNCPRSGEHPVQPGSPRPAGAGMQGTPDAGGGICTR
jgi:hypothetical protein